ncbi:DUF6207 family protein [Streptomyces sp. NPDC005386]|uniref:DUF6207 family protein n=1 Tax=Streptomyces sp. NPDC005386 TaxID=3154562 RepID=UPI0033ADAE59
MSLHGSLLGGAAQPRRTVPHPRTHPVRVTLPRSQNCRPRRRAMAGMRPFLNAHVAEPGLAVVEIAAADDATALLIVSE